MSKDKKVEITFEDQKSINTFSNLNSKQHDLQGQINVKKKLLEEVEDAGNELMLTDDENIRYVIGECFVHMEKDDAEAKLEDLTKVLQQDIKDLNAELVTVKDDMTKLKAVLYGKFGKNINLDE